MPCVTQDLGLMRTIEAEDAHVDPALVDSKNPEYKMEKVVLNSGLSGSRSINRYAGQGFGYRSVNPVTDR